MSLNKTYCFLFQLFAFFFNLFYYRYTYTRKCSTIAYYNDLKKKFFLIRLKLNLELNAALILKIIRKVFFLNEYRKKKIKLN